MVAWNRYTPVNEYSVNMCAAECTPTAYKAGPVVVIANKIQTRLEVQRLRMFTEYRVRVVALRAHRKSGALSLKGSQSVTVSTLEGGKYASDDK